MSCFHFQTALFSSHDNMAYMQDISIWRKSSMKELKIPKISPGAYIFQRLIFGGADIRRGLSTEGIEFESQNRLGQPYSWKKIYRFLLCLTLQYLRAIFQVQVPWGLIFYEFGGLLFGGAYTWGVGGLISGILRQPAFFCLVAKPNSGKSVQHGALSVWIDALFLALRAVFHGHIQSSFLRYASNVVQNRKRHRFPQKQSYIKLKMENTYFIINFNLFIKNSTTELVVRIFENFVSLTSKRVNVLWKVMKDLVHPVDLYQNLIMFQVGSIYTYFN